MKDTMTPTEAFIFRLKHEHEINTAVSALITTTALTVLVMLVLAPILIPLWILKEVVRGGVAVWNWFYPEPEMDPTLRKVQEQFKKARARK